MMQIFIIAILTSFSVLDAFGATQLEVLISARGLPDTDTGKCCNPGFYPPDPYAVVYYSPSSTKPYVEKGTTKIRANVNDVDWNEVFTFNIEDSPTDARWKFVVWDSNVGDDEQIGFTEVQIQDAINNSGSIIDNALTGTYEGPHIMLNVRIN